MSGLYKSSCPTLIGQSFLLSLSRGIVLPFLMVVCRLPKEHAPQLTYAKHSWTMRLAYLVRSLCDAYLVDGTDEKL